MLSYNWTKIFQKAQENGPYFQFASHYSQSYCCLESSWQVVADKSASEQSVDDQSGRKKIFSALYTFLWLISSNSNQLATTEGIHIFHYQPLVDTQSPTSL